MSQPFDAWSFCRDVLSRGAAIRLDSVNTYRSYEEHSSVLDSAARTLSRRLKPHLAPDSPADDAEPVTAEWLWAVGFGAGPAVPLPPVHGHPVTLAVSPDALAACLHRPGEGMVPVPYPATRGHVRRLCEALGVQLKESA